MSTATPAIRHILDPDTQAILLLCGWFGPSPAEGAPLSVGEYNRLVEWLQSQALRPGDLLDERWQQRAGAPIAPERLRALLGRGVAMALAVEGWTNQGLWLVGRSNPAYPRQLKTRLGRMAPPILYGAGSAEEGIPTPGLAIVGSRDTDKGALAYAGEVAATCSAQGIAVISGGARGVDSAAMDAALAAGGRVVGLVADSLAKMASSRRYRETLLNGRLVLLSPFHPATGFHAGNAMARNKYVYGLADWGLVISTAREEGGTWAGAVEAIKAARMPIFVRVQGDISEGNRCLLERGAIPFPEPPWPDLADTLSTYKPVPPAPASALAARNQRGRVGQTEQFAPTQVDSSGQGSGGRRNEPCPAGAESGAATGTSREPAAMQPATTVFDAVWPLLEAHLQEPCAVKTLAARLQVRSAQLQDWLEQAVREGKVRKQARPSVRYEVERSLFPVQPKATAESP